MIVGYLHIDNLYKNQTILLFRECYALEKIHGTSAHIRWSDGRVTLSSGGESHARFAALFDAEALSDAFRAIGHPSVTVYGEAYGGRQQKQAWRYGAELRFVAFDVQVGECWLAVPQAQDVVNKLGLQFVDVNQTPTELAALDAQRDASSTQAMRNGVDGIRPREGVVLRPLIELTRNDGQRIIAKHKRDDERETKTPRAVVDPAKFASLTDAAAIADEWVTPARLAHVIDKLPRGIGMEATADVIRAMIGDVLREAAGEIVDSREARAAIGKRAAQLFKSSIVAALRGAP